jgi:glycosyltransferase involved in cell wall biosynthesis
MRILYHHRTRGGDWKAQGVHIHEVIRAFQALGHTVETVAPPGVSASAGTPVREGRLTATLWKGLREGLPEVVFELAEIAYNAFAYAQLVRRSRRARPDMVYERYGLFCLAGMWFARRRRIPFVLEVNYTSATRHCRPISRLLAAAIRTADRAVFRGADGIAVVTQALANHLTGDFGVSPDKIIVTPNAVDPDLFSPEVSGAEIRRALGLEGKTVIGFVGSFLPWHGLDMLLAQYPTLRSRHPQAALLLVGDGPMRPEIERRGRADGWEASVRLPGAVPHDALPAYLAAMDIAVLPHSNEWGSPMKIFEYMAMAKPVVAPGVGPVVEVLADGEQGLLFPPLQAPEMTDRLERLLGDASLRREMGRRGRATVLARHTWRRNAAAILELAARVGAGGCRRPSPASLPAAPTGDRRAS